MTRLNSESTIVLIYGHDLIITYQVRHYGTQHIMVLPLFCDIDDLIPYEMVMIVMFNSCHVVRILYVS